jgi:polysaccharide export outer membrane protein
MFQHDFLTRRFGQSFLPLIALLFAALVLTSCQSGRGGSVPYEPANFGRPDVEATPVAEAQQRIGPLDKLDIKVFQVEALSGEFQVEQTGAINFPLIGSVQAQGKTTTELAALLTQRLGEKYLRSPSVQVGFKETSEQSITVDGSVRQPGVFPLKGSTSLMKAVAMARGTTEDANPSRVVIFRTVNGQRVAGAFDLSAIRKAEAQDPTVYGNDIIIVDGSRARTVFRDLLSSIPLLGILRPF